VQPDIVVICDDSILDEKRCNGAPDMVIEVVSPSSSRLDRFKKLDKYLRAGVREYWIADLDAKAVAAYILENGKYIISAYEYGDTISVNILPGCEIALCDVFLGGHAFV
jgi:Uma2 family endonuclease